MATAPILHPGDRLAGRDADGNETVFVVLSVHRKPSGEGLTTSTYVLREKDGWTITIGEGSLKGDGARFRVIDSEVDQTISS